MFETVNERVKYLWTLSASLSVLLITSYNADKVSLYESLLHDDDCHF